MTLTGSTCVDPAPPGFRVVRPAGPGWARIRAASGVGASPDSMSAAIVGWICGTFFVYASLFGVGAALAGNIPLARTWSIIFVLSGFGAFRVVQGFWRQK